MNIKVYDQSGKDAGQTRLPLEVFGVKTNLDLVHRVLVMQAANRRRVIANTKDRSQVSGGGKKPWRQKGTGRARAGSSRSPLWRHGGITFGPTKEKIFKKNIPAGIKREALFMALSEKAKDNLLLVLDGLKLERPKTKLMVEILRNLPSGEKSALIVLPEIDKNLIAASRNIYNFRSIQAKDLNCLDVLSFKYLILTKESIKVIRDTFLNKRTLKETFLRQSSTKEEIAPKA